MNTKENDGQDSISPMLKKIEELEYKFSDVRDNAIMEDLLAAVKEYITEKGNGNDYR